MEFEDFNKPRDSLTGFHTRASLSEYLHNQITASQTRPKIFSLLILDIDRFKLINDKYGHLCGDDAIKFFANIINEALKGKYFVARYGGDEFIIVMDSKNQKEAMEMAKHLKFFLNKRIFICQENLINLKTSIGIATYPADAKTAPDLIKKADDALYMAKRRGRNRIILASKLEIYYPTVNKLRLTLEILLFSILLIIVFRARPDRFVNSQTIYKQIIIKANYFWHKINYKYNYCTIELKDGYKLQGWVIKEDAGKVFLAKKLTDTDIIEVARNKIRILIRYAK